MAGQPNQLPIGTSPRSFARDLSLVGAVVASLLIPAVAMAASDRRAATDPIEIAGGQDVGTCGWHTAVLVRSHYNGGTSYCSGTLVHSQVVLYAAHCGPRDVPVDVHFGDGEDVREAPVEYCRSHDSLDASFCKLADPVPVPVTPILYGCEVELLAAGQPAAIVGWGDPTSRKVWGMTQINAVGEIQVSLGGNGTHGCSGDSGGPAFIEFEDGTWHTAGIASTINGSCGGANTTNIYTRADRAVEWIEAESGLDITPCHGSDGSWDPSPDCRGFSSNGATTGPGSWADWCEGSLTGGWGASCGEPLDLSSDSAAPIVSITAPADGAVFDDEVTVDVAIDADDGDGFGVRQVGLEIDGDVVSTAEAGAPWAFANVTFPVGSWMVVAIAEDWSGNVGRSEAIVLRVGQPTEDEADDGVPTDTGLSDDDGTAGASTGPVWSTSGDNVGASDDATAGACTCRGAGRGGLTMAFALLLLPGVRRRQRIVTAWRDRRPTPGRCRAALRRPR